MSGIRYDNKVAVITGSGNGIGKAYALELAHRGAKVVINDLGCDVAGEGSNSSCADEVVKEITTGGGSAVAHYEDVSTKQGADSLVELAVNTFGSVDILINNAGITRDKNLLKIEESDWDRVIGIHLKGAYNVTRPALKLMKANNFGRIIFTTSGVGLYGNFGQTNYAAAKLGLVGFLQTLAIETLKYNIKCNAVAPLAATRMTERLFPPKLAALLKPEHVTALGLFLVAEDCNSTGCIYNAAGGWYSKTEIICYEGTLIGDGESVITPEDIQSNWEAINSVNHGRRLNNLTESFRHISPLVK